MPLGWHKHTLSFGNGRSASAGLALHLASSMDIKGKGRSVQSYRVSR